MTQSFIYRGRNIRKSLFRGSGGFKKAMNSLYTHTQKEKSESDSLPAFAPMVVSGIQPTGIPHIGNYAGAISNWVKLQNKYPHSILLSIVDLHSITVPQNPEQLRQNTLDMAACLLACGVDPEKTILFVQSAVPGHTELAWILSGLCTALRLQTLSQWKEKQKSVKEPSHGLLSYPLLQAADIMLYKATLVPVGEDQTQHIELTRYLSRTFNRIFGPVFPVCDMISGEVPKIRSLRNPLIKMSKSDANDKSRIELIDTPEQIMEKIKKAVTDFTSEVTYDPENRPGVSNLIEIHMALTDLSIDEIVEDSFLLAEDTGMYKQRLAEVIIDKLSPIRAQILRYQKDPEYLLDVLHNGAVKASSLSDKTMTEVRRLVGLRPQNQLSVSVCLSFLRAEMNRILKQIDQPTADLASRKTHAKQVNDLNEIMNIINAIMAANSTQTTTMTSAADRERTDILHV